MAVRGILGLVSKGYPRRQPGQFPHPNFENLSIERMAYPELQKSIPPVRAGGEAILMSYDTAQTPMGRVTSVSSTRSSASSSGGITVKATKENAFKDFKPAEYNVILKQLENEATVLKHAFQNLMTAQAVFGAVSRHWIQENAPLHRSLDLHLQDLDVGGPDDRSRVEKVRSHLRSLNLRFTTHYYDPAYSVILMQVGPFETVLE
ncbi:hypothetical protein BKA70DRAFT_1227050 [Coprinopsis sp. MPI-PUGE-AT-0042]|nr:hypothetical protein BKA70DRAFT_1227050 [Coprinopsis sp. MPI-PUGE-AT-0042]